LTGVSFPFMVTKRARRNWRGVHPFNPTSARHEQQEEEECTAGGMRAREGA
jgi:hypothetical protein